MKVGTLTKATVRAMSAKVRHSDLAIWVLITELVCTWSLTSILALLVVHMGWLLLMVTLKNGPSSVELALWVYLGCLWCSRMYSARACKACRQALRARLAA